MSNPFVHIELHTHDLQKSRDFYSRLFGWKLEDMPMPGGSYTMINVGEGTGGGMMANQAPGTPSYWMAYVDVDDIGASTKKAKELGATIVQEVMPVGDFGYMSVVTDPAGAAIAMWQEKKKS